jgi:hypothetical protein
LQIKKKIISSHTADSKPVKQEVNGTVILPPLVFPGQHVKSVLIATLLSAFMLSVVVLNVAAPTKNENSDEKTKKLQGGIEAAKKANRCLKSSYKNFFSCMHGTRIQTF